MYRIEKIKILDMLQYNVATLVRILLKRHPHCIPDELLKLGNDAESARHLNTWIEHSNREIQQTWLEALAQPKLEYAISENPVLTSNVSPAPRFPRPALDNPFFSPHFEFHEIFVVLITSRLTLSQTSYEAGLAYYDACIFSIGAARETYLRHLILTAKLPWLLPGVLDRDRIIRLRDLDRCFHFSALPVGIELSIVKVINSLGLDRDVLSATSKGEEAYYDFISYFKARRFDACLFARMVRAMTEHHLEQLLTLQAYEVAKLGE